MNCLQYSKTATDTGEMYKGIALRICPDNHITGEATKEMIEESEKIKRLRELDILDIEEAA